MTAANKKPGCLGAILQLLGIDLAPKEPASETLPYRLRDDFLSPAEISFYHVLSNVVDSRWVICPKVRLADIFFVTRPNENLAYRNRITPRHVDFLLCHPKSMKPVLGIELDDSSHKQTKRKQRDEFVNQVFATADLALLHIPAQREYNPQTIASQISACLKEQESANIDSPPEITRLAPSQENNSAPLCPKCGEPMILRTAKRGQYQGRSFYGCANYPQCRETRPVKKAQP